MYDTKLGEKEEERIEEKETCSKNDACCTNKRKNKVLHALRAD
jgi:hypothetical protein